MRLLLSLGHSAAAVLQDARAISSLAISRHLCKGLNADCERHPELLSSYNDLSFGSKLFLIRLQSNPRECDFELVADDDAAIYARTVAELDELWTHLDLARRMADKILKVESLSLVQHLHDSTCVVNRRGSHEHAGQNLYVLKTGSGDFRYLYHKLQLVLSFPSHPNIMPPPLGLVTARVAGRKEPGVVGFLLPYYEHGSLLGVLPCHDAYSTHQRLKWAKQLTSAFIHIKEECGTFHPDLRPSNVLLSSSGDIVLCDFEQRGNWKEWLPPEVRYPNYADRMVADAGDDWGWRGVGRWRQLLHWYLDRGSAFLTGMEGYEEVTRFIVENNLPWFILSRTQVEKAQVLSLGLMLYCMFEGVSNVEKSLFHAWLVEPDVEFPSFKRTPLELREVIKRCTLGARQWSSGRDDLQRHRPPLIERRGSRFFMEDLPHQEPGPNVDLQF